MRLQRHQRFIDPLARQPHQVSQLLLGDAQHLAHTGVEHRVEQGRQTAGHAHVGVVEAINLARGNELTQPFVELVHHEPVERDGVVEQPVKRVNGQARHHALAQRLDVVAVRLALHGRALTKPAARGHARERHGLALGVVAAHLEQPLHHAEPVRHGPADAAHEVAGQGITHQQGGHSARARGWLKLCQPRNALQLL